jgi:Cysteine dioxygenase type I
MTLTDTTRPTSSYLDDRAPSDVHGPAPDVLGAIAAGLAAVTEPWELSVGELPTDRRYRRLLATPVYEAWVIRWPSGESLDPHDHGGSAGAFSVVSGELEEATFEGDTTVVRTFTPGQTSHFRASQVHAIVNRGAVAATSVHVYSPPLSSMTYYGLDTVSRLVAVAHDAGGWDDRV